MHPTLSHGKPGGGARDTASADAVGEPPTASGGEGLGGMLPNTNATPPPTHPNSRPTRAAGAGSLTTAASIHIPRVASDAALDRSTPDLLYRHAQPLLSPTRRPSPASVASSSSGYSSSPSVECMSDSGGRLPPPLRLRGGYVDRQTAARGPLHVQLPSPPGRTRSHSHSGGVPAPRSGPGRKRHAAMMRSNSDASSSSASPPGASSNSPEFDLFTSEQLAQLNHHSEMEASSGSGQRSSSHRHQPPFAHGAPNAAKHFKRSTHPGHVFHTYAQPAFSVHQAESKDVYAPPQQARAEFAPHTMPRPHHSAFQQKRAQTQSRNAAAAASLLQLARPSAVHPATSPTDDATPSVIPKTVSNLSPPPLNSAPRAARGSNRSSAALASPSLAPSSQPNKNGGGGGGGSPHLPSSSSVPVTLGVDGRSRMLPPPPPGRFHSKHPRALEPPLPKAGAVPTRVASGPNPSPPAGLLASGHASSDELMPYRDGHASSDGMHDTDGASHTSHGTLDSLFSAGSSSDQGRSSGSGSASGSGSNAGFHYAPSSSFGSASGSGSGSGDGSAENSGSGSGSRPGSASSDGSDQSATGKDDGVGGVGVPVRKSSGSSTDSMQDWRRMVSPCPGSDDLTTDEDLAASMYAEECAAAVAETGRRMRRKLKMQHGQSNGANHAAKAGGGDDSTKDMSDTTLEGRHRILPSVSPPSSASTTPPPAHHNAAPPPAAATA